MSRAERRQRRAQKQAAKRTRLSQGRNLRAPSGWAPVVQALAFVRKELVEILRQPRLLILLVVGPFIVLFLFGLGYRNTELDLRTQFVGPEDSIYADAVADYEDVLEDYIDLQGFTDDEEAARQLLQDGDLDVVVVFPTDPLESITQGESAAIEILHEELDPFQQAAIEIAAQLAVQEVNASVLSVIVGGAQSALQPVSDLATVLADQSTALSAAAASGDQAQVTKAATATSQALVATSTVVAGTQSVLERLGGDEQAAALSDMVTRLETATQEANTLAAGEGGDLPAQADDLSTTLSELGADLPALTTIDPAVLVRPFESDTENLLPVSIDPTDYFAPSSIILLLQHLALTFAALSLVRDRELGLLELLRVGPLSSSEILTGKTIAYLLVGSGVGAILIAASVYGLGVPFEGDVAWAAVAVVLVLVASLALGMVLSLISKTETQAVQFAMLSLLAGMFFSGFILDTDGLTEPYRYVSYLLPVTYGIDIMQDVMLRGVDPQREDLIGLGALVLGYGLLAVLMLRRRLRTE